MITDLKNKNIIIFGATSGIGKSLSMFLDKFGANLILIARDKKHLNVIAKKIKRKTQLFICDFNDNQEIKTTFNKIRKLNIKIDGLVYLGGVHLIKPISLTELKDLNYLLNVNLIAPYLILKEFSSNFLRSKMSSVVFITSISALAGQSALSAYAATKGAIISLTKSAAIEMARNKIRVNCIAPGHLEGTKMSNETKSLLTDAQYNNLVSSHPLGIGKPIDVSRCIGYLLSDASKWITGSVIKIDGGFSVG